MPLALAGALAFSFLGFTTLNIYANVGLVTLVGLVSKNGILIVEFANKLQEQGADKFHAVVGAASTRLRPILMTSVATVAGHFPLILATGPGAGARNSIGWVLVSGMIIGTGFTLFVVPSIYLLLARNRSQMRAGSTPFTARPWASTGRRSPWRRSWRGFDSSEVLVSHRAIRTLETFVLRAGVDIRGGFGHGNLDDFRVAPPQQRFRACLVRQELHAGKPCAPEQSGHPSRPLVGRRHRFARRLPLTKRPHERPQHFRLDQRLVAQHQQHPFCRRRERSQRFDSAPDGRAHALAPIRVIDR